MLSSHPQYRKENAQQKRYLKPTLRRSRFHTLYIPSNLAVILACWLAGSFCCCPNPPADPDERGFPAANCCCCGCCSLPKVLVPRVLLPKKQPNSEFALVVLPNKLDRCYWPASDKLLVFVGVIVPSSKPRPAGFAWLPSSKPPPLVLWPVVVPPPNKPPPVFVVVDWGVPKQTPTAGLSDGRCAPKKIAIPDCWLVVLPKRPPAPARSWTYCRIGCHS